MEHETYIALGSNQGDRELNLLRAVAEIGKLADSKISDLSPFFETTPVGITDQPLFYNAVLRLTTRLSPHPLLSALQQIEDLVFHRERLIKWGPRNIDLDILLYDNVIIDSAELTIPHPLMLQRRFVLQPLAELAPDLLHPVAGLKISELLQQLQSDEVVSKI